MKTIFNLRYWLFLIGLLASLAAFGQDRDSVETYVRSKPFSDPETVIKQIYIESGWLQCNNCALDQNNLFGWSYDGINYLTFDTWQKSIDYCLEWERKYCDGDYRTCVYNKWGAYDMDAYMEVLDLIIID